MAAARSWQDLSPVVLALPVTGLAWLRQVNFSAKLTLGTFGRIISIIAKMIETSSQKLPGLYLRALMVRIWLGRSRLTRIFRQILSQGVIFSG
jgi:hypothetical protein